MSSHLWRQLAIASNWPILAAVLVLSSMGTVSIWAVSPGDAQKQLMFMAIGFVLLFGVQMFSYLYLGQFAWPFYALSLLLLVYTLVPGLPGTGAIKGARAWISFGPRFKLEPSELMKVAFAGVLARYLRFRSNYRTLTGLIPPFVLTVIPLLLILKQPALGVAMLFLPALFAMLFVAGAKLKHLLGIIAIGVALTPLAWLAGTDTPMLRHLPMVIHPYQRLRVVALFNHDEKSQQEAGYQQKYALIAFASSGWFGRGVGNVPVGRHVPEAHDDMIFALIGEQFGFVGVLVMLAAYFVLFAAGVEVAAGTKEPFGRLLAVGIVCLLATQTFINLMVATRLMPVTGITLPFVSYGGSSLMASFVAAALLLNIGQNRPLVIAGEAFEFD